MKTFKFHYTYYHQAPALVELELPDDTQFAYITGGYDFKTYHMDTYENIWTVVKDDKDGTIKKHLMTNHDSCVVVHQWADLIFIQLQNVTFPQSYLTTNAELYKKYNLSKYHVIYLDKEKKIISISKLDKPLSAESMIVRTVSCDYSYTEMEYMFSFKKEKTSFFPGSHITAYVDQVLYVNDAFANKIYRSYLKYIKANLTSLTDKYIQDDIFHDLVYHSEVLIKEQYLNKLAHFTNSKGNISLTLNVSEKDLWNMNLLMKSDPSLNTQVELMTEMQKVGSVLEKIEEAIENTNGEEEK